MVPKLGFNQNHNSSSGYYRCPKCKAEFYGGGSPLHKGECNEIGYEVCIYMIGPKIVEYVKEWARKQGDDKKDPYSYLSLNEIKEQLPQHLI